MAEVDDDALKRLILIHNEKTKLSATYMNGVAVAVLAVGGIAPIFSILGGSASGAPVRPAVIVASVVCWSATLAIHWGARRQLRSLR